jgi:tagatose-1,6-bisphosphate aldolase
LSQHDHVLSRLSVSQRGALRHVGAAARRAEAADRTRIADLLARAGYEFDDYARALNVFVGMRASCCTFTRTVLD